MASAAVKQLNIKPYFTAPDSLLGGGKRRFPFGTIIVGALFSSFSGIIDDDGRISNCTRRKTKVRDESGASISTVYRSLKKLEDDGILSPVEGKENTYIFNHIPDEEFIRIDKRLLTQEFNIYDEKTKRVIVRRYLTFAEVIVASLIITRCDNRNHSTKTFDASNQDIANELVMAPSTVEAAIQVLKAAKIIVRKSNDVGVNRFKKSKYSINRKYKRVVKESKKAKAEHSSEQAETSKQNISTENKKYTFSEEAAYERKHRELLAERDRNYYNLKHAAEEVAERNYERAMQDMQFRTAENELGALGFDLAMAELKNLPTLAELQSKVAKLEAERSEALERLGLSEKDLKAQYPPGLIE